MRSSISFFTAADGSSQLGSPPEVSGYLVEPSAFKAGVGSDPVEAGSIPVHLRV